MSQAGSGRDATRGPLRVSGGHWVGATSALATFAHGSLLVVVVVADDEATRGQFLRAIDRALLGQDQARASFLGPDVDGRRRNSQISRRFQPERMIHRR
jgi:hypothetical protein